MLPRVSKIDSDAPAFAPGTLNWKRGMNLKLIVLLMTCVLLSIGGRVALARDMNESWVSKVDADYKYASPQAYEDWKDLKFGMRIHWGIYSTLGLDASWTMIVEPLEVKKLYLTQYMVFNPTEFNADQWAGDAQRWGFKYFVFTTKHHDGFSMFDTQTTTKAFRRKSGAYMAGGLTKSIELADMHYSIMDGPFKRDIVKELCDAFRKKGLGVGLYYSHMDWNDPNFRWDNWNIHHVDRQVYDKANNPQEWQAFIDRERKQVEELCTKYGKIQQIDFDGGWPKPAQQDLVDVIKMARKLQPDALFRNRGVGAYGDFSTPEHWTPTGPDDPRIMANNAWQTIEQIHTDWAWTPNAKYKPKEWIVETLISSCAMGGNFMVGVSPMPNGKFPPETIERLEWTGKWLAVNGEGIYATRPLAYKAATPEESAKNAEALKADNKAHIQFTRSKDWKNVYAIVTGWPGESVTIRSIRAAKDSKITMLGADGELQWTQDDKGLTIRMPEKFAAQDKRPCEYAWVFKIQPAQRPH